jgi:hypothetical protein
VKPRVTQRITRMWGHRKDVPSKSKPGEKESVQVLEVRITERNLAYLEEAVRIAKERLATLKLHYGSEAIEDLDRRVNERTSTISEKNKKDLSYAVPKLQLWPGNNDGEKNLTLFAEAIQNLPPAQETPAPVEEAADLPLERGGFDGLGSLFG